MKTLYRILWIALGILSFIIIFIFTLLGAIEWMVMGFLEHKVFNRKHPMIIKVTRQFATLSLKLSKFLNNKTNSYE